MTHPTYKIDRIEDLLKVPADRRAACVRELLYALELLEFSGAESLGQPMDWTDDGDASATLYGADGEQIVKLRVTR